MPPKAKSKEGKGKSATKDAGNGVDLSGKLKGLADNWNSSLDEPLGDFTNWEDGVYHVRLADIRLEESKKGRLQVRYEFQDIDGEQETNHYMFDGLDTVAAPDCLRWLQKHIRQLGFEPPKNMNNLTDVLQEIKDAEPEVTVQLKTNGEFLNTYIQNVIED